MQQFLSDLAHQFPPWLLWSCASVMVIVGVIVPVWGILSALARQRRGEHSMRAAGRARAAIFFLLVSIAGTAAALGFYRNLEEIKKVLLVAAAACALSVIWLIVARISNKRALLRMASQGTPHL